MKILILSLFLGFISVTNADTGFVLQKSIESGSIVTNNIVNSSSLDSCLDSCDAEYDYYCSGGNLEQYICEYLEDELYACYDDCESSYP